MQSLLNRLSQHEETKITPKLPHLFFPRPYQAEAWEQMETHRRAIIIWNRRAGKDKTCFNYLIKKTQDKVGVYYYVFPSYAQGKKAIWEGIDKSGVKFLDHIPNEIIESKNNSELKIVFKNGSLLRIVGSDKVDSLMGTPPAGIVFSEFPLQNPHAWDYIRPILAENKGFAIFNGTPRGKNHYWDLKLLAESRPDEWYVTHLTVDDTQSITPEELAKEKAEMSDDIFQQEYYCSFTKGQDGSFYGKFLSIVDTDGRITRVPHDPYALVDTFWDLGVGDSTAIIFAQRIGQEIHIIDFYEAAGEGLQHYAKILKDKCYRYRNHWAPHDIRVRELSNYARTRLDVARDLGIDFEIVPDLSVFEGIELTRSILSKCWFDEEKCKYLLKCLLNYVKKFSEAYNVYSDHPLHNWASHSSDAFRMLGVVYSQLSKAGSKSLAEIEAEDNLYRRRY